MKYKALFIIAAGLLTSGVSKGQGPYIQDINGKPFRVTAYTDIEGSPYLVDYWAPGAVKMRDGKAYKDTELKYDVLNDQVLFKNKAGEPMYFADPVKEFALSLMGKDAAKTAVFRNGYTSSNSKDNADSYYEVLVDGKTQLLKKEEKKVTETKAYNSATTVKSITPVSFYYLYTPGNLVKIKKDKKTVLEALAGKDSAKLEAYVKEQNLNLKEDHDLVKLITYYNSL